MEKQRLAEVEKQRLAEVEKQKLAEVEKQKLAEMEKQKLAEMERLEKQKVAKAVAESNADIILNALKNLFTFTPPPQPSPSSSSLFPSSSLSPSSILVRGKFIIKKDNPNSLQFEKITGDIPQMSQLITCDVNTYIFSFDEEYFMELKEDGKPAFYVENTSSN